MKVSLILLTHVCISLIGSFAGLQERDLCGLPSCNCKRHIHCDLPHPNDLSPACPANVVIHKLYEDRNATEAIVEMHNRFRDKIASGQCAPFPAASKMNAIGWSNSLAKVAERNVRQCQMKRDECCNTRMYANVGQNLGGFSYREQLYFETGQIMGSVIGSWFDEHRTCPAEYIDCYPRKSNETIHHFTLTVQDDLNEVGCAAASFAKANITTFLFTCNYSCNNTVGRPVYVKSKTPGSGCRSRSKRYKHLCNSEITRLGKRRKHL